LWPNNFSAISENQNGFRVIKLMGIGRRNTEEIKNAHKISDRNPYGKIPLVKR
jgi:hypothetical protein